MSDISLKEHVDSQVVWIDRYFAAKIEAIHAEINKAEEGLKIRLTGMNEFREALKDQTARLITRMEYEANNKAVSESVRALELSRANIEGRAVQRAIIGAIIASLLVGLLVGITTLLISRFLGKP